MKIFKKYLEVGTILKLSTMKMVARLVVEGLISGMHSSPYKGFNIEFSEYRQYMPGDEIKNIDWKVYAKTDKYYVKQFEEDTNLKAYILLDISKSMTFGSKNLSKLHYGAYLTASLSYLMLKQGDSVGLVNFDNSIKTFLPPSSAPNHFHRILTHLEAMQPQTDTNISDVFHELAQKIKRRALIIIISDLFDDPEKLLTSLKHFRHKKHEVIVFHVMDPEELTLPYQKQTRFVDLESGKNLIIHPKDLRKEYLDELKRFLEFVGRQCNSNYIDYSLMNTDEEFSSALLSYLAKRSKRA